jgi:signal transduction histidine kinase
MNPRGAAMKMLTKTNPKSDTHRTPIPSSLQYPGTSPVTPDVPYRLALIDSHGNIVAVNKDWMDLAEKSGAEIGRVGPGTNYLEVCRQASLVCTDSRKALAGIHAVLRQRMSSFAMEYVCDISSGPVAFHMDVAPISFKQARLVIAHRQVTGEYLSSHHNVSLLQQFALRLIHAQEEERQKLSLEIHDDLGSKVALMALSVREIIEREKEHSGSRVDDLHKILDEIITLSGALRDLSHGLQLPLLRYGGIRPALKWLCERFEGANRIHLAVAIPAELPRLPAEKELCIFRIAQESLQNVMKHSGAGKVSVVLKYEPHQIRLTVSDNGCGFIRSKLIGQRGLGLLSMEARALSVRGHVVVTSSRGEGTTVLLRVPLEEQ